MDNPKQQVLNAINAAVTLAMQRYNLSLAEITMVKQASQDIINSLVVSPINREIPINVISNWWYQYLLKRSVGTMTLGEIREIHEILIRLYAWLIKQQQEADSKCNPELEIDNKINSYSRLDISADIQPIITMITEVRNRLEQLTDVELRELKAQREIQELEALRELQVFEDKKLPKLSISPNTTGPERGLEKIYQAEKIVKWHPKLKNLLNESYMYGTLLKSITPRIKEKQEKYKYLIGKTEDIDDFLKDLNEKINQQSQSSSKDKDLDQLTDNLITYSAINEFKLLDEKS